MPHAGFTPDYLPVSQNRIRVIRVIARLNVGGPAKHVVWLTAGLQETEFESLLVAGTVPSGEEDMGYFADELGIAPLFIPQMSREISVKDAVTIWKLYRLFLRERPSIVHTHTAKAGTVGRVAGFCYRWLTPGAIIGRPRNCKFVHTYHGHIFHSYYGRWKTRFFIAVERLLARVVTDRILVISEQQRTEINESFQVGRSSQFKVVPLGLDFETFSDWAQRGKSFRKELGLTDQAVLIGIVGRLTEIKNHELFLQSIARFKLNESGSTVAKFVIIGDGHLRSGLERLSRSLGLEDDVIFAGNRKDPEEFYPALDVVALTSKNEGTPLTLIEAMANARPVIATSVGGVIDLLGDCDSRSSGYRECERGISVPPGDDNAFAAGMVRLVHDEKLRRQLGLRGLEFVKANYRKDRLIEDIKVLYRELLNTTAVTVSAAEPGLHSRA